MTSRISVQDLGKQYQLHLHRGLKDGLTRFFNGDWKQERFWALRHLSFEAQAGEAIGVIGKNGSGKSTLLRILAKITTPTTGRVELTGRINTLLEIGTGFHPELTGRENIFLNGSILGMSRHEIKMKFDQIVAFSGVEKFLDTPVKHFSSGMFVRLAFSIAAHLEPDILLVDEVLAVGDESFRKQCMRKMKERIKAGTTVLIVSHDTTIITDLCQRCLWLSGGILQLEGPTAEVMAAYQNPI